MKRFFALLLALMCLCPFVHAEELTNWISTEVTEPITELFANETLITTVGTAEALAPIDIAVLSFSVDAKGETVAEANKQVMASIQAITTVLNELGVEESQIWHSRYDVEPNLVYHNTKFTEEAVIEGYVVEIVLCVRLTDISIVGDVIDSATQSGADSTHDLTFERSGAQDIYNAALVKAAQQAMERAKYLAEGSGMTLGDLVSVTELSAVQDGEAKVEVSYRAK